MTGKVPEQWQALTEEKNRALEILEWHAKSLANQVPKNDDKSVREES